MLKLNGYNTAQFGKCHEVPVWEASQTGPFDHWPMPGGGFEYFYGFLGGETNQWYPAIYENTTPVEAWGTPEHGYHFMDDMTDKAIAWVQQQESMAPDKPFFIYFAPGATHAPHHVPKAWADRYAGKFDQGWDRLREETFARQKQLGVIPQAAELTARSAGIPAWDEMSDKIKPVLAREMEVYAGFLSYTDHHTGRLIDALDALGELDDTLIYVIIGDNGASAEGTFIGTTNEGFTVNRRNDLETEDYMVAHKDDLGTHKVAASFAYDGGGVGKGGSVTLLVDEQPVGEGRVEQTIAFQYSFDETLDVGVEVGSTVSAEYKVLDNAFTGKIKWVRLDIGSDSHDHLIDPEHRIQVAMLKQ